MILNDSLLLFFIHLPLKLVDGRFCPQILKVDASFGLFDLLEGFLAYGELISFHLFVLLLHLQV